MQKLAKNFILGGPALLGGILVLTPLASAQAPITTTPGRYSDRDRSVDWNKQKQVLQQNLKPGESKDFYRKELEKAGWLITAVNSDKADYVEWEIVKGDQSYEVQIELDKSNKASKVV